MGLFLMICIIFVFGLFFGASNLGDSGYDIMNEVTTAQPSTTTSKIYISLHLLLNLVSSLIFNSFQMITSQPLKFFMQVLFAKVMSNTFINTYQIYICKTTNHFSWSRRRGKLDFRWFMWWCKQQSILQLWWWWLLWGQCH